MTSQRPTVLLIEDEPDYARVLQEMLVRETNPPLGVTSVDRLRAGLDHLAKGGIDVVLLDLFLPDSRGLDTFTRIHLHVPEIPIVVLTVYDDDAVALEAVRKGAQDYLLKGHVDGKMLSRVIRYAIERHRMQATLRSLSLLDDLTGLYNRRGFLTLGAQHVKLALRTNRGSLVMMADLDGLKQINDSFGHPEGDLALVRTAEILRGTFRTSDILGRIGGDEFAVLAIEARQDSGEVLMARLQENLVRYNAQPDLRYKLSISAGVATLDPEGTLSVEDLMARADAALYDQKRRQVKP